MSHRTDAVVALVFVAAGQAEFWTVLPGDGPRVVVALTGGLAALALGWRRRAPMAVLVAVLAAGIAQAVSGADPYAAITPYLTAVFAIGSAAYFTRRPVSALLVALVLIVVWVAIGKGFSPGDLLYAGAQATAAWLAGRAIATRALQAQLSEQRAAAMEREVELRATAAVAEERLRIARELHDVVAHSVSVMTLHVGGIRRLLREDQHDERAALRVVEHTGRQAVDELHLLLGVLRTPQDVEPAAPGLAGAAGLLEPARTAGLVADLHIEGSTRPLSAGVELSAFRILQEAVTNVLKHSTATRIRATIRYELTALHLDVVDDGIPHPAGEPDRAGHGLVGMRERVALYGGTLEVGPLPDRGYRVAAVVPLPLEPA